MTNPREPQSVIEEAERAAADGDYASAEQLLREAAALQEASVGPVHPDLANTLNNLAIVCEMLDKPADAERYFRRASDMAAQTLEPDHPFVATSRRNLEDFCAARGIVVDPPAAPEPAPPPAAAPPPVAPPRAASPPAVSPPAVSPPAASPPIALQPADRETRSFGRPAIAIILAAAVLASILAARSWLTSAPAETPKAQSREAAPPAATERPAADAPRTTSTPTAERPPEAAAPAPKKPTNVTTPAASPVVAAARLCRQLSTGADWSCTDAGPSVDPGLLFFYTRIKSPAATSVVHRWYHGEHLRKSVELAVAANMLQGYRTYSRNAVADQGEWRVEVRTREGVVLHEMRFTVR